VFILVPRILQRQWGNLSKHVTEVGVFQPGEFPLSPLQHLPIPVVLLQIDTYQRTLPSLIDKDTAARLDGPPAPHMLDGTGTKPNFCVGGCESPFTKAQPRLRCSFYATGFTLPNDSCARPCYSQYHIGCLQMGAPFQTRLKISGGLAFPKLSELPHFVCEVCTVRETVGREIQATPKDTALIMLERAWLIDIAHYWAALTYTQYQQQAPARAEVRSQLRSSSPVPAASPKTTNFTGRTSNVAPAAEATRSAPDGHAEANPISPPSAGQRSAGFSAPSANITPRVCSSAILQNPPVQPLGADALLHVERYGGVLMVC